MSEPKPKITTLRKLEKELLSPAKPVRSEQAHQRVLDKIRKLKEARKLT